MKHETVETNIGLMIVGIIVAISFGTLVELVPLMFLEETNEPIAGLKPLPALEQEGRDIYIREGCNTCHSQMIRPLRAETERYGHYSVAGEHVYEHPFLWGSKRTGPDLARVGKRYSDDWHPGSTSGQGWRPCNHFGNPFVSIRIDPSIQEYIGNI